jgi:large subunit ribosomal protein L15
MNTSEITKQAGAKRKRKRVGRGEGSGSGKTSGRGHKGAGARSGYRKVSLAEGAVFPLFRRLPKFGFNNAQFRTEYQVVNVGDLDARFDEGTHVTPAALEEVGLIRDRKDPVKILGNGELKKKCTVEAHRFSASAASKIEATGGTVTRLGPQPKKKFVKREKPPAKAEGKAGKKDKGGKKEKGGKKQSSGKNKKEGAKDSKGKGEAEA